MPRGRMRLISADAILSETSKRLAYLLLSRAVLTRVKSFGSIDDPECNTQLVVVLAHCFFKEDLNTKSSGQGGNLQALRGQRH